MKTFTTFFTLLFAFFASSQAQALFELRGTYGLLASSPTLSDLYSGAGTTPAVAPTYGLGADALFVIPIVGLGAGIRYENLALNVSEGLIKAEATNTRTALILNYRIINTLLFLGPILTYGLTHSGSLKLSLSGTAVNNWNPGSMSSYSAGLEAGVKLAGFLVGAEAGYQDLRWNGSTDTAGGSSLSKDINMSGTYFKVLFGIAI